MFLLSLAQMCGLHIAWASGNVSASNGKKGRLTEDIALTFIVKAQKKQAPRAIKPEIPPRLERNNFRIEIYCFVFTATC